MNGVRRWLRARPAWVAARALGREGVVSAWRRARTAPRVLATPPVRTRPAGDGRPAAEVHMLLWDRDHLNALWAAKSFFRAGGADWPLYLHQGGPLGDRAVARLAEHLPDARLVRTAEADGAVNAELARRGLPRVRAARDAALMMRKLVDPAVLGRADYAFLLDTDVLFFRRPVEVLDAVAAGRPVNLFNRDRAFWYTLTPAAARDRHGVDLVPELNAGCGLARRAALDLDRCEGWLADPDLTADPWLVEQTLQALLGSAYGVEHLPPTYALSTEPGLSTPAGEPLVAKHYPGHPRRWLYQEGMPAVLRSGLLG